MNLMVAYFVKGDLDGHAQVMRNEEPLRSHPAYNGLGLCMRVGDDRFACYERRGQVGTVEQGEFVGLPIIAFDFHSYATSGDLIAADSKEGQDATYLD